MQHSNDDDDDETGLERSTNEQGSPPLPAEALPEQLFKAQLQRFPAAGRQRMQLLHDLLAPLLI